MRREQSKFPAIKTHTARIFPLLNRTADPTATAANYRGPNSPLRLQGVKANFLTHQAALTDLDRQTPQVVLELTDS
jgi:hypothetical protein